MIAKKALCKLGGTIYMHVMRHCVLNGFYVASSFLFLLLHVAILIHYIPPGLNYGIIALDNGLQHDLRTHWRMG
jgi:hypothetical protein